MNSYHHVLVDAKNEYTKQLVSILAPRMLEGFQSVYDHAKNLGEQSYYQIAGFCDGIRRGKTFKYKYQKSMRDVKCNIFL